MVRRPFYIHSVKDGSDANIYGIWKTAGLNILIQNPKILAGYFYYNGRKKEVSLMTSCYTSRQGFLTLDYYVRLVLEKDEIKYIKRK